LKKNAGERGFVEFLRARSRPSFPALRLGIGDDAAILRPTPGFETLLTSDLLIEKVHFDLRTTSPWELGAKAVAASLSDIAAMGGLPRAFLVSLAVPRRRGIAKAFFESLYSGMRAWGSSFGADLAGGDTSHSPSGLMIDILMLGEVEKKRALLRSGAKPGDLVFCTGTPGDSAAGLAVLQKKLKRPDKGAAALMVKRHLSPVPRCLAGRFLSTHRAASACIDVSDGLSSELHHLARESGVAIDIDADAVPLSAAARALSPKALDWALRGGEDYELLFTAPPSKFALLQKNFSRQTGVQLSQIGRVKRGRGVRMRAKGKWRALPDKGYDHQLF
jgi:thiamine-monophosphate kinase